MERGQVKIGEVYTIARTQFRSYKYFLDYDKGLYINVRVVKEEGSCFLCTTRRKDGQHLGPGGGWAGKSEIILSPADLEPLKN